MTPKMTTKCYKDGAKSGPKTTLGTLRTTTQKLEINSVILGRPGPPKRSPKTHKNQEKLLRNPFLWSLKKNAFSEGLFYVFLGILGGPRPWKSSQNAVRVCKNGSSPFPQENCKSSKNSENTTKKHENDTTNDPKMTPKWSQKWSENDPGDTPDNDSETGN